MTLSFSKLNEIGNLYESIAASEQEQLNELNYDVKAEKEAIAKRNAAFGFVGNQARRLANATVDSFKTDENPTKGKDTFTASTSKPIKPVPTEKPKPPSQQAKQEYAASKGKYYSSSDQKTYGSEAEAKSARADRLKSLAAKQQASRGDSGGSGSGGSGSGGNTRPPANAKVLPSKPTGSAMDQWAKANPKLAAAKAERDRTRGTSATTNPLMKDMKSNLPAPAPKPAASSTLKSATDAASKPSAFKPATTAVASSTTDKGVVPASNAIAAAPKPKPMTPTRMPLAQSFEYDAYDLVLEYLFDNGHVDTVDEAHYVMMELDAETIQTIVEGAVGEFADKVASTVGSAVGTVQRAAREIPKYAKQKVDNVAGTYEYARQRADANAPSGAKMSVPTKPSTPRSREFSHGGKSGMTNPGPNFGR